MYPELFKIPFIDLPVPTYGLMMVTGFLAAVLVMRRLSRDISTNPIFITNASLYALIAGVVGARLFYVVHYFDSFRTNLLSVFAVWHGGLEFLGGVLLAIVVLLFYLLRHKLSIRHYFDILAIGLMLGLAFGRIGCFLKGDCYSRPTEAPLAVRFPYGSDVYHSITVARRVGFEERAQERAVVAPHVPVRACRAVAVLHDGEAVEITILPHGGHDAAVVKLSVHADEGGAAGARGRRGEAQPEGHESPLLFVR